MIYSYIFAAMIFPIELQTFHINEQSITICIPHPEDVQQFYSNNKEDAYWGKVWPASIGLCQFLSAYPTYIAEKNILELAAGLGLAGLFAARIANHVTISDKEPKAQHFVSQSASNLIVNNITSKSMDWLQAHKEPLPDVLLLSDVNYDPAVFHQLHAVLQGFLHLGVTIIISTPQRLVAKEFISTLLPYSKSQWNNLVSLNNVETEVSVFVLTK